MTVLPGQSGAFRVNHLLCATKRNGFTRLQVCSCAQLIFGTTIEMKGVKLCLVKRETGERPARTRHCKRICANSWVTPATEKSGRRRNARAVSQETCLSELVLCHEIMAAAPSGPSRLVVVAKCMVHSEPPSFRSKAKRDSYERKNEEDR